MEKFNILCDDFQGGIVMRKTEGERITIQGVECFIHTKIDDTFHGLVDYYFVSHLETGHYISYDLDRKTAIKKATTKLKKNKDKYLEVINKAKEEHPRIKFPINE